MAKPEVDITTALRLEIKALWVKGCEWEGMTKDEIAQSPVIEFSDDNPFMKPGGPYDKMLSKWQFIMRNKDNYGLQNPSKISGSGRSELVSLFHLARTAGKNDRHSRLVWAAAQYHRMHPEVNAINAYMVVDEATRPSYQSPYQNPRKLLKVGQRPAFTVKCVSCGKKGMSDQMVWYFDPQGKPFVDYYCDECAGVKNPTAIQNRQYFDFHRAQPSHVRRVKMPQAQGPLTAIGKVVRIEYEPYGKSKHVGTRFYHVMGDTGSRQMKSNTILSTDKDGQNLFFIKDDPSIKRPFFSNRGIIG